MLLLLATWHLGSEFPEQALNLHQHWKGRALAAGPPRRQWQAVLSWAPQTIADGDCSHEIKRRLLLGRKVMTNLDRALKSRDILLLTKVHIVEAMVYSVVTYGCELDQKEG